jgi:hypothetical protein
MLVRRTHQAEYYAKAHAIRAHAAELEDAAARDELVRMAAIYERLARSTAPTSETRVELTHKAA